MKKNIFLLCILCLATLNSCAKVPDEVQSNMDPKNSDINATATSDTDSKLAFDTIENIFKTIDEVQNASYDNLVFSDDFTIQQPEQLGNYQLEQISNFNDNSEEIMNYLIGDTFDKSLMYTDPRYDPPAPDYDDKDNKIFCTLGNDGFYNCKKILFMKIRKTVIT